MVGKGKKRMKLNKRIMRELRDNWTKYIGLVLLNIISVMVIVGYCSFADSAIQIIDDFQKESKLEDGNMILYNKMNDSLKSEIEEMGLTLDQTYYIDISLKGGEILRVFENRENLNRIAVAEGSGLKQENDILLDKNFATENGYKIGDTISIDGRKQKVSGYGISPEYVMSVQNIKDSVPNHESVGVAYVSQDDFEKLNQDEVIYSYSYQFKDASLSEKQQKNLLDEVQDQINESNYIVDFYKSENNPRVNYCQEKMKLNKNMVIMICVILILILSYVIATSVISMIEEDSAIIGTLYAMGYNRREIIKHYMRLPLTITLFSSVIGCVLGMTVICKVVSKTPASFFNFPNLNIKMSSGMIFFGLALPVIIVIIVNEILLFRKLSCPVLRLLRKEQKIMKLHKIDLSGMKIMSKFKIRNLMSGMKNYITLCVALMFVVILLLFGLGMKYSLEKYPDDIRDSVPNQYTYYLKAPYETESTEIEKAVDANCMYNNSYNITLRGISQDSQFYSIDTKSGSNDVFVSSAVSKKFGLKKGMKIKLKNKSSYDNYNLMIAGVYDYSEGLYVFMDRDALNDLLDNNADYYNIILTNQKQDIPEEYEYACVSKEDVVEASDTIVSMLKSMIVMLLGAAVIVGIVTIYLLVKILVDKERNHISLIKVFGYQKKEIRRLYLNISFLVVLFSLFFSIPIGNLVMDRMWLRTIASIQGYIGFYLKKEAYLFIILIVLGTYFISHAMLNRHADKIPMTEALKTRE